MLENIEMINSIDSYCSIDDRIAIGLNLEAGTEREIYMRILGFSKQDKWFMGGFNWLMAKTLRSLNCVKGAIEKLLKKSYIIKRTNPDNPKNTDYFTNFDLLREKGLYCEQAENNHDVTDEEQVKLFGKYENVRLTDSEYKNLSEKYPENFASVLENFSEKMYTRGYYSSYRTHSEPLSEWCRNDMKKPVTPENQEEVKFFGKYENVRLTDSEYCNLSETYGKIFTDVTLVRFSEYVFTTQKYTTKNYRSHSEVLKKWADEDVKKAEKPEEKNYNIKNCSNFDTSNIYNKKNNSLSLSSKVTELKEKCCYSERSESFRKKADAVIPTIAELATADFHTKNSMTDHADFSEKIDNLNNLYDFIDCFYKYFEKVSKSRVIRNIQAYMRITMYDFIRKYRDNSDGVIAEDYECIVNCFDAPETSRKYCSDDFNPDDYECVINCFDTSETSRTENADSKSAEEWIEKQRKESEERYKRWRKELKEWQKEMEEWRKEQDNECTDKPKTNLAEINEKAQYLARKMNRQPEFILKNYSPECIEIWCSLYAED